MPYKTVKELPASTKDMPAHAKRIWMAAFNSASKQYDTEEKAFAIAFSAVKKLYEKGPDGKWHRIKESEPNEIELDAAAQAWVDATVAALTAVDPVPLTEQYDMPEPVRAHHEECYKEAIYSALNLLGRRELEMTSSERDALTSLINRLVPKIGAAQEMDESVRLDTIQEAIEALMIEADLTEAGQKHRNEDYELFDQALELLKRLRGQSPKEVQAEQAQKAADDAANDPTTQMLDGYHGAPAEAIAMTESASPETFREAVEILQEAGQPGSGKEWAVRIIQAGTSKNGRTYPLAVLAQAAPLFDGAKVYTYDRLLKGKEIFDHLSEDEVKANPQGYAKDLVGYLKAPRMEGSSLMGTLVLFKSGQWLGENLQDAMQRGLPVPFGLSIDAGGEAHTVESGGQKTLHVDAITAVRSVDVVTHPAAGGAILRLVASHHPEADSTGQYLPLLQALREEMAETTADLQMSELLGDLEIHGSPRRQIMALLRESRRPPRP